jgi:uncharacterized membrane protein YfcA
MDFSLFLAGLVAGAIDSIAGGGGLITLPALLIHFGQALPAAHSIGTNKIVGTLGALIALVVYLRKGWFQWRESAWFALFVGIGSWAGSHLTAHLPQIYFKILLWLVCPVIFYVIWNKDLWLKQFGRGVKGRSKFLPLVGLACGVYDGGFGPGGGTFMFLGLVFGVGLPIVAAMAASKFVNVVSAGTALVTFQSQGYVHWQVGLVTGLGMSVGAFLGARLMTTQAPEATVRYLRMALGVVCGLLLIRATFV